MENQTKQIKKMSIEGRTEFSLLTSLVSQIESSIYKDSGELVLHEQTPNAYGASETYIWRDHGMTIILKSQVSKYKDYAENVSIVFSPVILEGSAKHSQIAEIGKSNGQYLFKEE